ncbi:MAG: hypothetical protein CO137_01125 [Candidatus Magasanikbacteria bacterium CG_4_9_14_3_um_filter_32_9]|uniref:Uncharacterized protein n=1 Tax=Candidatus Magasanikbacteria bacterium CG_4_9_14_3_um_filter_32_9 TaxID=1974644 RepID=A0A2M7Z7B8_9BACT|nr:MAG: hypothetical protein CO137_01125 [Candidatus Magasanikbacteria bacterium CG_4_9_14_3_um_filter_32_9]
MDQGIFVFILLLSLVIPTFFILWWSFSGDEFIERILERRSCYKQKKLDIQERQIFLEEKKQRNTEKLLEKLERLQNKAQLSDFDRNLEVEGNRILLENLEEEEVR